MSKSRYSLLPIEHENLWKAYKTQQMAFWTAEEIDLGTDIQNLDKLNEDELHFIKHILAFFNESDGMVNENLAMRFYDDVKIPEARAFYSAQILIETVHSETYGNLLEAYVKDPEERMRLFNATLNIPAIAKKGEWFKKWISSNEDFAKRLVAFSIIEGVFFSGSFCAIYWLKNRKGGMYPGLSKANQFIARDEGLHCEFAATLFHEMGLHISDEDFYAIIDGSVFIEKEFITESLPVALIGMNAKLMKEYIEYVADTICDLFDIPKRFNTENPFDFMSLIDATNQSNFFESRVSEYSKVEDQSMEVTDDF